jgi:dipeptidyl aminopeptidase/acylaminoacyl peptidase
MRKAPFAAAVVTLLSAATGAQTAAPTTQATRYSSEDMRAQLSRFTASDMLNVVTASVLDLSEDGRFVAFTERRPAENSETDNYRYGDPTFIGPAAVRLVVVNTDTGARMLPFGEGLMNVRQASFSRDGSKLAILLASGASSAAPGAVSLSVWPTAGGPAVPVAPKSPNLISAFSNLEWTPDGSHVVLFMRTPAREKEAADRFKQLTQGPIIVSTSKEPFLEWDEMQRQNRFRSLVEVDVTTGAVDERLSERKLTSYRVARDGSFVVLQEDVTEKTDYDTIGGSDNKLQVLTRGDAQPKTLLAPKDLKGLTLRWSDDSRWFAYAKQGEVFVRSVSGAEARSLTPKPKPAAAPDKPAAPPVTTPDEKKETEQAESFSVDSFSRDGSKLLITSRKGWYVVNIADASRQQILTLDADEEKNPRVAVVDWAPDASAIYATWAARDRWSRGVVRIDAATGQMTPLVRDARLYSGVRFSRDGRRVVFSLSDGDRPSDLQVADAGWSNARAITKLNPWLDGRPLPKSELVKYRDVDGKELYGVLRYPVGYVPGQRYPTVFEIYETFFDNGFNARAAFLASHGYAIFHPSVNLVIGRPGESWVKGVTTAANKLIEMGVADPDRLGVHGTSYGGYATVLLLTQTDRFKAAINISGKVDMVSFYTDSPRFGVRNIHAPEKSQDRIGGTLWEYPERYLEHSAIMQADRIKTPLLNISGDQDPNVPASQSREIYYALRRLGRDVEWVRYVNGAHRPPNSAGESVDFENRILAWYDKYLKADEKKK